MERKILLNCVGLKFWDTSLEAILLQEGAAKPLKGTRKVFILILLFQFVWVSAYLVAHALLPTGDEGGFFWVRIQLQWGDWLFWSLSGALLSALSRMAKPGDDPIQGEQSTPKIAGRIARSIFLSLLVLFLVYYGQVDLSGVTVQLKSEPAIGVGLAFIFGFYQEVTDKYVFQILRDSIKRFLVRFVQRITGTGKVAIDEETYVQQYIDPKLQRHYLSGAATVSGRQGHQESHERLVRYKTAKFVGNAGFTLNAFRVVFIGTIREAHMAEIIAHEASHVAQKHLSDSIQQETQAYITGVRVDYEIKNPNKEIPDEPSRTWLKIHKALTSSDKQSKLKASQEAEKEIRKMKEQAPIYGIIPTRQKEKLQDFLEMLRQGGFLIMDAIGLRKLS